MKYSARSEDRFMWRSDGRSFSFDSAACVDARDGQGFYFDEFFDRFPEDTTHVSYDEDANTGTYSINGGEEISEAGDLRCSALKTLFDKQVQYVEAESNV